MDMMEIRRQMMGVIAGMASGADFVKGSFTVPDGNGAFTLNIGKTFSKYLFYVEMDDESKQELLNSGETGVRVYAFCGIYPALNINNNVQSNRSVQSFRVNPSTGEVSESQNATLVYTISENQIQFVYTVLSGGANYLYQNLTYNYYIVEIK